MGNARATAGPKWLAAQEVVFLPTGLRDLEGVPNLSVSRRDSQNARNAGGERCGLWTLSCDSGRWTRTGCEEGMITPVRGKITRRLSEHALCVQDARAERSTTTSQSQTYTHSIVRPRCAWLILSFSRGRVEPRATVSHSRWYHSVDSIGHSFLVAFQFLRWQCGHGLGVASNDSKESVFTRRPSVGSLCKRENFSFCVLRRVSRCIKRRFFNSAFCERY